MYNGASAKLDKVLFIGTYAEGWRVRPLTIFCHAMIDAKGELHMTGVISPYKSGDCAGGCGQINMEFAHRNPEDNDRRYSNPIEAGAITYAKGWDAEKWLTLLDIWSAHHLNFWASGDHHAHPLPTEVVDFLTALPKASRKPAWI